MPKWTTSHTFQVVIGCVMAVLTFLVKDPTIGPYAQPVLAILTVILGYLGLTSGKAFGGPPSSGAAVVFALCLFGGSTLACNKPLPPNTPADVSGAVECVTTALLTTGIAGVASCAITWGPALVADALQMLLASSFAASHPELVPAMQAKLTELRAGK
jgi:hypothetical protein